MASYIDPSFRLSLTRQPSERTSQDLTLINAHLKSLEALSSFRDSTIRALCKTVRYEKHEANDVLYRTGDVINNWFILLSGSVFIDGSMYLPRSGFGRRSAGQTHRIHDCLVLETSEMLVIDYPKQVSQSTLSPLNINTTTTSNNEPHVHRSNTNGTTTVAVNGASEPVAISSSLSIPTSSSLDSNVLNQRIMIKHTSPKLTTFATLASSVNSYEESTTLHSSTTRVHHCVVDDTTSNNKLIKTTSFQVKADKLKVISTSPTSTSTSTAIHQPYNSNHLNVNVSAMSHSTTSETTTANSLVVGGNDDRMSLDDDDDEGDIEDDEHGEQDLHNLNILCNDSVVDSPLIVDSSQHIKSICIITGNSAYRPHSKKGSQSNSNPSNNNNQIVVKHHPFKSSPSSVSGYNEPTSGPLALPTTDTTTTTTMTTTTTTNEEVVTSSSTLQPPPKLVTTQLLVKSTSLTTPPSRPAAHHQHTNSCSSSISSTSAIKSNSVDVAGIRAETASVASVASNKQPDEDRLSAVSSAPTTSKDVVREVLEKDPKERTDEDIDLLFEFMQTLPAFSNLTEPIVRKLCACMVIGVVEKADTLVLDHNERLDSWAVVLNGHVECTLPDGSIKAYHIGDHFGVSPVLDAVYHQGVMRTKCDDCQFVLVKQADYHDILNKGKENTRSYYEPGSQKVCMLCELRPIGGGDISSAQISTMSSSQLGEIVLRATPDKLVERLVWDDVGSILDPTYIQDFLLTYRVFIDSPVYISKRLFDWFMNPESLPALNNSNSSPSINRYQQSTTNGGVSSTMKKKVYRIVLEWITNHFNDFESNRELYDFVERFQEQLSKEKMYEQFRVLSIAISTKSKQRVVTLARSKRDDALMFTIQGGWEKGYGIFVSRVERETKAHELGLRRGDQIIEVNGHSFMHITLAQATETLKSFTHASITVKYNPIGFNEMLLHPEKSPHRNKKSGLANNNKAYLIEYLKQQQNHYQQQIHGTPTTIPMDSPQSPQLNSNNVVSAKKSIGSIPPLPPSASTNSLTPRNKSKDKPPASSSASHFKLLSSTTSSNLKSDSAASTGSASSNTNQIRKILGRFNRKAHSKDLEHLSQVDSSAPALKSITRSPSPSFSAAANFHQASNSAKPPTNGAAMLTSDYSSSSALSLSRNNSISNLNDIEHQQQQAAFDSSLARMSLQDQQQFVGEHVLKIYKNDQNFKYLVVHKETSTKEVVMLALNEFNIIDDIGSNAYSLCEVSVDADRVIKQKRLPDQLNNLAERLPLNARYYLKCNTSPEQFLSDPGAADELIKDSSSTFLQLDALELAAQLTLRDYCLFKSIESSEYIDALFRKNAPPPEHLSKFADLSNEEMFWVVNEILHESSIVKRVRIIKQFIQIAHICRECKNFNSLFAILSGLDHLSVTRLKDTWDKVSNKHKKLLHELKTILDPSFNMMKYRNLFKNELIQPPIIPFFPICQKDLYFLKESCETVIDGLINFEKLRKLSKSVRSIVQMTSSPFDLTSMRDVPTSHSVIFSMFGCTNPGVLSEYSLVNSSSGGVVGSTSTATVSTLGSVVSAKLTNIAVNVKADHVKKMYEEAVMVRKVRHYLAQMSRTVEKNEERLRLISSTLEHSTSTSGANNSAGMGAGNTLKRNPQSASSSNHYHHKPSPNSSLGGSVSSINAALNLSGGQAGISSGNGPLMTNKNALFGAHSPDAVKKLLALSETKVKTVKNSSSSSSVPLSQMSNSSRLLLNTSSSSSMVGGVNAAPIITTTSPTSSSSVAALSPKTKHRSVSSSQPIPPQTSTSASNVVASQSATSANSSASKYTLSSSNTETNNSKSKKNDKMTIVATNGSGIKSANEADSGRASMASNVDQEQCSPTFQQRAFVLNRYLSSDQQYKSTNKVFINTAMTTSGSTRQQAPKAPPLNGNQQLGGEMLSNAQILKNHMRNSSNGVSETPLNNQNGLEEEEDQVSAV